MQRKSSNFKENPYRREFKFMKEFSSETKNLSETINILIDARARTLQGFPGREGDPEYLIPRLGWYICFRVTEYLIGKKHPREFNWPSLIFDNLYEFDKKEENK